MPVSVAELGADFLAFSSHKMLGPTGVGVLWARRELLEAMPPFMGGGDMIAEVHRDYSTWNELPWKFEAGTPNIADVVAFGAAIDYLQEVGMEAIREHERELVAYALESLGAHSDVTIYGPRDATRRGGVVAFNLGELHPHDLSAVLDYEGVAIRAGHHCCQLLNRKLGMVASARASFYLYNTEEEVDTLVGALGCWAERSPICEGELAWSQDTSVARGLVPRLVRRSRLTAIPDSDGAGDKPPRYGLRRRRLWIY
jgi:cysteine desulfurase/selenocysteine lyase